MTSVAQVQIEEIVDYEVMYAELGARLVAGDTS
jgi:hypothetical protein